MTTDLPDWKKRQLDNERPVIVGLTSTAARLIGLCVRDGRLDLIDEAAEGLAFAIEGLERFGAIAGCDSGTEYTTIALQQIIGWCKTRDYDAASKALHARYNEKLQPDGFYRSMEAAIEQWQAGMTAPGSEP